MCWRKRWSSVYLATEALKLAGTEQQKQNYLPRLAASELVGTVAFAELTANIHKDTVTCQYADGAITGSKQPVAAQEGDIEGYTLFIVDLNAEGVSRQLTQSLDPPWPT